MKKYRIYGLSPRRANKIFNLLPSNLSNTRILDIGCGTGELGWLLKKKGALVYGVDFDSDALKIAKKRLYKVSNIDLNKDKLPFKINFFDIIIASEIIEHLQNPEKILFNLNPLLKKTGFIIITTPNFLYWGNRLRFLMGKFKYEEKGMFDKNHIHFYTYRTLLEDLKSDKFTIISEDHIYSGNKLNFIRELFPSIFAYQFVIKAGKTNA